MRGFKTDANRQGMQVTKINRDISDVQLRATITNTLSNVRNAYWDYVFAVQSVQVAQTSVDLAMQLVAGQPDARAGRHDGADRRRHGAVAGGDREADSRRGAGHEADGGARAQADCSSAARRIRSGPPPSIRSIAPISAP